MRPEPSLEVGDIVAVGPMQVMGEVVAIVPMGNDASGEFRYEYRVRFFDGLNRGFRREQLKQAWVKVGGDWKPARIYHSHG